MVEDSVLGLHLVGNLAADVGAEEDTPRKEVQGEFLAVCLETVRNLGDSERHPGHQNWSYAGIDCKAGRDLEEDCSQAVAQWVDVGFDGRMVAALVEAVAA